MKKIFAARANSAYEAIAEAQRIAFAPIVFQAARSLRELGILTSLDTAGPQGMTVPEIAEERGLSHYGVSVLIECGLSADIVEYVDETRVTISKVGHFLLHDRMTRINMDFNHLVCYAGMQRLDRAITDGQPAGLRTIDTKHATIYEALSHLPDDIRSSWYAFDHFYSDAAYPAALDVVLAEKPGTLVDIGTNQGRFSILAAGASESLHITMIDLPDQLAQAVSAVRQAGYSGRIDAIGMDVLRDDTEMPLAKDAYWLSQFLCCFSQEEIVALLRRLAGAMAPHSKLYVLETCWDRQQHEAAAFSIVNTSPYFTCIANGNSKMYAADELLGCFDRAGLQCDRVTDGLGAYHTLFECSVTSSAKTAA